MPPFIFPIGYDQLSTEDIELQTATQMVTKSYLACFSFEFCYPLDLGKPKACPETKMFLKHSKTIFGKYVP